VDKVSKKVIENIHIYHDNNVQIHAFKFLNMTVSLISVTNYNNYFLWDLNISMYNPCLFVYQKIVEHMFYCSHF